MSREDRNRQDNRIMREVETNLNHDKNENVESPEQIQEQTEPKPKKAVVKCSYNAALRKHARRSNGANDVIKAVKNGTEVTVLGREGDYSKVMVDGIIGYIDSKLLR